MDLARTCRGARAGVMLMSSLCGALVLLGAAAPVCADPPRAQAAARKNAAPAHARDTRALERLTRALHAKQLDAQAVTHSAAQLMPTGGLHTSAPSAAEAASAARFITLAEPLLTRVPGLAPHLAEACARTGDFERARVLLEQAFAEPVAAPTPSDASDALEDASLSVASLAHVAGQSDLAEQLLRAGLTHVPRSPALLAGLGLLLVSSGRADEALPYLSARRELGPRPGRARPFVSAGADLAYALMASGAPEAARALLARGCDADPENCAALRVRAALESGEVTDALRTAEEALSRATHDVTLQYLAAESALRVGDLARARAIYAQIAAEHPDEQRAQEALRALSPE